MPRLGAWLVSRKLPSKFSGNLCSLFSSRILAAATKDWYAKGLLKNVARMPECQAHGAHYPENTQVSMKIPRAGQRRKRAPQ